MKISTIKKTLFHNLQPYLILVMAALVAYLPVTTMFNALKNDAITLDYPIKFFINECLQNNVRPFWMNTWAMGFPLESILTWSYFSPLQFLAGNLFSYNLYLFHLEFLTYIILAGWGMYYLLNKHISHQQNLNTVLSCSFMLSGFMVGSSQWMAYVAAAALLPFVLASYLNLIRVPSAKNSMLFTATFYLMLTGSYPAFAVVTVYVLVLLLLYVLASRRSKPNADFDGKKLAFYLAFTVISMTALYSCCLYYSIGVFQHVERGNPINSDTPFFGSNYLHPKGLLSLFVPFSSTRFSAINTEGTMNNTYIGLLPLLLLPLSIFFNLKKKGSRNLLVLLAAICFLLLSFGSFTPFREAINILPGFSYFRNSALLRLFSIIAILTYFSATFSSKGLKDIKTAFAKKMLAITAAAIIFMMASMALYNGYSFYGKELNLTPVKNLIENLSFSDTLLFGSGLQIMILIAALVFYKKNKWRFVFAVFLVDVVVNTLVCTPFFTVGSHSVKETNEQYLKISRGFPVQTAPPSQVATQFSLNGATWNHLNVFAKKTSSRNANYGPLVLKNCLNENIAIEAKAFFSGKPLVFGLAPKTTITVIKQNPGYVAMNVALKAKTEIYLQQNFYPGWHAYLNGKEMEVVAVPGAMKVTISESGLVIFKYQRNFAFIVSTIVNLLVLSVLFYALTEKCFKKLAPAFQKS